MGVCGRSGSGKTTLVVNLVPKLLRRGLRVAVVKHCTHDPKADVPGKDSDRLFRAGADVLAAGPGEAFARFHADQMPLEDCLRRVAAGHDLVIVEGYRGEAIPKIRLGEPPPDDRGGEETLLALPSGLEGHEEAAEAVWAHVQARHAALPTMAALLIGGKSARMGRPKALLRSDGRTLVERIAAAAAGHVEQVVLVGEGTVPSALASLRRLPDAPGACGPLAGLLSAMRWRTRARWLALSCDLARVESDAVAWLLGEARPGCDAVIPLAREDTSEGATAGEGLRNAEPLFAVYEPGALPFLERAARAGEWSLRRALASARVLAPRAPEALRPAWTNVNTPEEWERARMRGQA